MKIGVLGGSFDPVHRGHRYIAEQAVERLGLDKFIFIPCHIPPHKKGFHASNTARLDMLHCAISDRKKFFIDERELKKQSTSYSVETLQALRDELGERASINFVVGWDSWLNLPSWYRWQELITFANFAVFKRAGDTHNGNDLLQSLNDFAAKRQVQETELTNYWSGKYALIGSEELNISSTEIRSLLSTQKHASQWLIPEVNDYILKNDLYLS